MLNPPKLNIFLGTKLNLNLFYGIKVVFTPHGPVFFPSRHNFRDTELKF